MIISAFDRVENIVGKGGNAGYQYFLLFPCFEKDSFPDTLKDVIVWEWVNLYENNLCYLPENKFQHCPSPLKAFAFA